MARPLTNLLTNSDRHRTDETVRIRPERGAPIFWAAVIGGVVLLIVLAKYLPFLLVAAAGIVALYLVLKAVL